MGRGGNATLPLRWFLPVYNNTTHHNRWSKVCKAAGVAVEDALDMNIMLSAKLHVRILVDTLLSRLGVGQADLLAARLETAGVSHRFSGKALFGSQLEWVDVEVDEDAILQANASSGRHLLAVGEMIPGHRLGLNLACLVNPLNNPRSQCMSVVSSWTGR